MNRYFKLGFSFHIWDRLFLFSFCLVVAAVLFAMGIWEVTDFVKAVVPLLWIALHIAGALYLANSKIRNCAGCWWLLLVMVSSDFGLYRFVENENYYGFSYNLRAFLDNRKDVAIWTFVVSFATLLVGKLIVVGIRQLAKTKIPAIVSKWFETPASKITALSLVLLVFHLTLIVSEQGPREFAYQLSNDWSTMNTSYWWTLVLPTVVLLPFLLAFCRTNFFRSWKGWLAVVCYFLVLANPSLISIATGDSTYVGEEFLEFNLLFSCFVLFLFLGRMWLLTGSLESAEPTEPKKWQPNLSTVLIIGVWLVSAYDSWQRFDFESLAKWPNSERWHVAKFVRELQRLPNCRYRLVRSKTDFVWDDEGMNNGYRPPLRPEGYAWLEIEIEATTQKSFDRISELSSWPGHGALIVKNVNPKLDIGLLASVNYDVIFKGGAMSTDQLESVGGQPSRGRVFGGWCAHEHPTLIDTEIIQQDGYSYIDDFVFTFSSTSDDITRRSFDALVSANYGGLVTVEAEHRFSASTWQSLIAFTRLTRYRQYPPGTVVRNNVWLYPRIENLDQHGSWFEGVPAEADEQIMVFMRPNLGAADIFSAAQIRAILNSGIGLHADLESIGKHQFQAAWDFLIGLRKFPIISMEQTKLVEYVTATDFSALWDFHWVFSQAGSKRRTQDITGLMLPTSSDEFIQDVCDQCPNLERLFVGRWLIDNVDIFKTCGAALDAEGDPLVGQTLDSLASLGKLRELYISERVDDLSWISKLPHLETLAVQLHHFGTWNDEKKDFHFPGAKTKLKKIIFLIEEPTDALCKRLPACPTLEEVIIIEEGFDNEYSVEYTEDRYQYYIESAKPKVTAIDVSELRQFFPAKFRQARKKVWEKLRRKYLND